MGLSKAHVWIGENLSYENEKISSGEVSEFTEYESAGLTVMAVYNDYSHTFSITGIPDSYFIRSDVPMTKREIRAGVISRMAVRKNSCVYDIGAGTGSVSVELALHAPYGTVYAVERTEEGCSLIARNAEKFGLNNIEIVHGNAADVIDNLPVPDEVFIGGSGGESEYIFDSILRKNPNVHVVATAVTLETLQDMISLMEKNNMSVLDIVQIAVSGNHTIGLKNDGTVLAVGWNSHGQCDVAGQSDVAFIATGEKNTVLVKYDGSVVAVGDNSYRQCDTSGVKNIVSAAVGSQYIVYVNADGKTSSKGCLLYTSPSPRD